MQKCESYLKNITKYTFEDIAIFQRIENNGYISISDFQTNLISECEYLKYKSNADFLIVPFPFFEDYRKQNSIPTKAFEADISDLVLLSGLGEWFTNKFNDLEDVLAMFCAKKIIKYHYGKIECEQDSTYAFYRYTSARHWK